MLTLSFCLHITQILLCCQTVTGGKIGSVGNIIANVSIIHSPSCNLNDDEDDDEKLKPPPKKKKHKNAGEIDILCYQDLNALQLLCVGKRAVLLEDMNFKKKKVKTKTYSAMVLYTTPKLVVLASNTNIWNKTQRIQLCESYEVR